MEQAIFRHESYSPMNLMEDCYERLNQESLVRFSKISAEEFYKTLNNFPDGRNESLEGLDDSFTACIGGTFRSPRMARFLAQKGIILSNRSCRGGYPASDLPDLVKDAKVDKEGYLIPKDFKRPMKTLFIGIDTETEECAQEGLICFVLNLVKKQGKTLEKINLNVVIVDGEESESANLYRQFRAYDPDIDDAPPPFPINF